MGICHSRIWRNLKSKRAEIIIFSDSSRFSGADRTVGHMLQIWSKSFHSASMSVTTWNMPHLETIQPLIPNASLYMSAITIALAYISLEGLESKDEIGMPRCLTQIYVVFQIRSDWICQIAESLGRMQSMPLGSAHCKQRAVADPGGVSRTTPEDQISLRWQGFFMKNLEFGPIFPKTNAPWYNPEFAPETIACAVNLNWETW